MFKKIDHIGIAVMDLKRAVELYSKKFGLSPFKTEELKEQGIKVASFKLGDSWIELLGSTREDSPIGKFLRNRGEGLHHLCYQVENLEETLEVLKQRGLKLIDEKPRRGAGGKRIAFLHPKSTQGVLIEITEG